MFATALITPIKNKTVDIKSLELLIELQKPADAIVVLGSTGQGMLLNDVERDIIIKTSVKLSKKTIVGCSGFSTDQVLKHVRRAKELGADAVLVLPPPYCKPSRDGVVSFFKDIHDNSDIEIIVYNNPSRNCIDIHVDDLKTLASLKRITGIKDSTSDLTRILKLKDVIHVFAGDDINVAHFLIHGAKGMISVASNIAPELYRKLFDSFKCLDFDTFLKTNDQISKILYAIQGSNPGCVQYVLSKLGKCEMELKAPLTEPSEEIKQRINSLLSDI